MSLAVQGKGKKGKNQVHGNKLWSAVSISSLATHAKTMDGHKKKKRDKSIVLVKNLTKTKVKINLLTPWRYAVGEERGGEDRFGTAHSTQHSTKQKKTNVHTNDKKKQGIQ